MEAKSIPKAGVEVHELSTNQRIHQPREMTEARSRSWWQLFLPKIDVPEQGQPSSRPGPNSELFAKNLGVVTRVDGKTWMKDDSPNVPGMLVGRCYGQKLSVYGLAVSLS